MKITSRSNSKGSSLIELLISLPATLSLLTGGLTLSYYIFAKHWIQYQLHEAILCTDGTSSPTVCNEALMLRLNSSLPFGQLQKSEIRPYKSSVVGLIKFKVVFDLNIVEVQRLNRPISMAHFQVQSSR